MLSRKDLTVILLVALTATLPLATTPQQIPLVLLAAVVGSVTALLYLRHWRVINQTLHAIWEITTFSLIMICMMVYGWNLGCRISRWLFP